LNYPVFRIAKNDTNKFVLLVNPLVDASPFIQVIEIFDIGGFTPVNNHYTAHEGFYVLSGQGEAQLLNEVVPLQAGCTLLLKPGNVHSVKNTGNTRLYCLTTMAPNEGFAELICAGVPDTLDAEDYAALGWIKSAPIV
jgi:mannose-6-phosphate isomerase-like protein (cupin superfamily)